ncbi:hypothetical protein D9611_004271 [Ephemerocybe angulata]|uniref:Uncharacterized protein n=2 Tax=Ephemerocybe angulata TaxID=980116 RepID=A0A8H6IFP7_9AGAR|nr:hypothetical protein D9611_004271 [Tulosesus angulatus]KAF6764770.1 hypothetical protein DFP72DRAFT_869215 [Tulosesus angulatus]
MPIDCSVLFSLARTKLQLSFSHKDNSSLHRWVLLKNSINSPSLSSSVTSDLPPTDAHNSYSEEDDDESADELDSVTVPTFMFPDAGNFVDPQPAALASEAQWLDSLLETLGDDDDDYFGADSDPQITSSTEDDDEHLFSPSASPMSSSDELPHMQPSYFSPSVQYSAPFPAYPSSLASSYDPSFDSSLSSLPPPYEDPLPYYDSDDVDDLAVPESTIDDTSDDESDPPQTPSLGRSTSPLSFIDAASIPLPPDRSSLRHAGFRVLFDEDSCFYPFDPLPFSDDVHSYNFYQEC